MRVTQIIQFVSSGGLDPEQYRKILAAAQSVGSGLRDRGFSVITVSDASSPGRKRRRGERNNSGKETGTGQRTDGGIVSFDVFLSSYQWTGEECILNYYRPGSDMNRIAEGLHLSSILLLLSSGSDFAAITEGQGDTGVRIPGDLEELSWNAGYAICDREESKNLLVQAGFRCPIAVICGAGGTGQAASKICGYLQSLKKTDLRLETQNSGRPDSPESAGGLPGGRNDSPESAGGLPETSMEDGLRRMYSYYRRNLLAVFPDREDLMISEDTFVREQSAAVSVCNLGELVKETDKEKFLYSAYRSLLHKTPEEWEVRKNVESRASTEDFQRRLLYAILHSTAFAGGGVLAYNDPWKGKVTLGQRCRNLVVAAFNLLPEKTRARIWSGFRR